MLVALDYLGAVGLGATSPQLFRADNGRVYVVKLQNNRLGPKILANELLGARLGEYLGLCFPDGGIIRLDEALVAKSRRLIMHSVPPGRHFACRYLSGVRYICRNNLRRADNLGQMAGVMLFDHLLHNLDRTLNRRNLLLRREGKRYRIYAIDNSHLFRRGVWTAESLEKLADSVRVNRYRTYGVLLKYYLEAGDFSPYLEKIKALDNDSLTELVAGIPAEWLPHRGERDALWAFLARRRAMAEEIVTCLKALIPDKHRRADIDKVE